MIVKTGDFFIYISLEKKDFRLVGGSTNLERLKAAIPEGERNYDSIDKMWVVELNEHNTRVIEELSGTSTSKEEE